MSQDPLLPRSSNNLTLLAAVGGDKARECKYTLNEGTEFGGQYRVIRALSTGDVKGVYLCRRIGASEQQSESAQNVVLKLLNPHRASEDPETAAARFKREVLITHGITHPNVVDVYEYIEDGDMKAYSMEHVDGGDLASLLEQGGPLPPTRVTEILKQMCRGVREIHKAGIVHRDLKPKNILLTKDGTVKISDFGVAKAQNQRGLTAHGALVGTVEYCSPEYIMRGTIDERLDIYSIGIIGYELLTGSVPFADEDVMKMLTARMSKPVRPPHEINDRCPESLSAVVCKALEREPEQRYQTVQEMLDDLQMERTAAKAIDELIFAEKNVEESKELLEMLSARSTQNPVPRASAGPMSSSASYGALPEVPREKPYVTAEFTGDTDPTAGLTPELERILLYAAALIISLLVAVLLYNSRKPFPDYDPLMQPRPAKRAPIAAPARPAPLPKRPGQPYRR